VRLSVLLRRSLVLTDQHALRKKNDRRRYAKRKATAEYLGVTPMTTWRWGNDPALDFPKPAIINHIPYYDLDAIDAWMCARVAGKMNTATEPQPSSLIISERETKPGRADTTRPMRKARFVRKQE
jgi:hypothetical protein